MPDLEQQITELTAALSQLRAEGNVAAQEHAKKTDLQALATRVDSVSSKLDAVSSGLGDVLTEVNGVTQGFALKTDVETLKATTSGTSSLVASHEKLLGEVMTRLAALEQANVASDNPEDPGKNAFCHEITQGVAAALLAALGHEDGLLSIDRLRSTLKKVAHAC